MKWLLQSYRSFEAKEPITEELKIIGWRFSFYGRDYIIPSPFDKRLILKFHLLLQIVQLNRSC